MKAVRLHAFHAQPVIDEVPEPTVGEPLDVIVKIGGAGVCRTDLHIIEGQWDAAMGTPLPYILGHENAGWVHQVGSGVTNVAVGDTVILHPTPTCGLCRACRAGDDMHCVAAEFPGLSRDGGMAEYLRTSARACVKLDPRTRPADVAALADAQHTVVGDGGQVDAVRDLTGGAGANVVLDFVAEQGAEQDGFAMTGRAGSYFVIGYGGQLQIPTLDIISTERNIIGNIVGTYNDLAELMVLAQTGRVTLHTRTYPMEAVADAFADLDAGRVRGHRRANGQGTAFQ